jgi:hypothetical protein
MSNRKNYNSIVFLTTLSVYLGLVLAGGATPSVLAQAALTRDFDIKKEIVVEDDLDKKPDDEEKINFAGSLESYFGEVENLIKDLKEFHKADKFSLNASKFEIDRRLSAACNAAGDPAATSVSSIKNLGERFLEVDVQNAIAAFSGWEHLADCLKDEKAEKTFSTGSKLKLLYDSAELKIEISAPKFSRQRADFLAEQFNQTYSIYRIDEEKPVVKTIYENTSFNSENNQIFIVTRLPRASIDSLLAEQDAQ